MTVLNDDIKVKVMGFVGDVDLPSIRKRDEKYWDLNRLHICLAYGNEELFIKGLDLIAEKNPVKLAQILTKSDDLFCASALNNFSLAIDKLVECDADVNEVALLCACRCAAHKSLETLLKYYNPGENITPLLKELSNAWENQKDANAEDFDKCYELLLKKSSTDVNYVDKTRRSVMYYVRNQSDKVTECLKLGAYIGNQNVDLRPDVAFITPKTLQKHFDNCIQIISRDDTVVDKRMEYIEFDFKNLIPSENRKDTASNEMGAIEFMSNSDDHRHLLSHPLIWSFISLKWDQLALVYYMDFYLYLLFALLNMGCILMSFEKSSNYIKVPFTIITAILTIYVILRCVLHLTFCSSKHLRSWTNFLQCLHSSLIIIFVLLVLVGVFSEINRTVAAISVLLIALKLFILAGSMFWTFSKFYIMFLNVAWSSIKSLQLCIIFIPSFLMSYYLLIRDPPLSEKEQHAKSLDEFKTEFFDYLYEVVHPGSNKVDPTTLDEFKNKFFVLLPKLLEENGQGENEEKTQNDFVQTISSVVKTIMTWHKKWSEEITSFDLNALGLIVVLITLLSIIFMNLMNGLAVNDAKRIQSEAELTSLVQRCRLLARYEEALSDRRHWFRQKWQGTFIMELFEYFTQFESLEYMRTIYDRKIYVGLKNEIIHFIDAEKMNQTSDNNQKLTEYKTMNADEGKLAMEMLYNAKNKSKLRMFSKANEIEIELEESHSYGTNRLWKTVISSFPFFDEREKMNPQIVQLARQIIETREVDKKGKEEQSHYKEQIAKLQTNMEVLLQKIDKLDTFDNVNSQILQKLTDIESKIRVSVD
ncbi:transient receptor potential cation channel protein painless-like isoform X2 [Sitodiplosis mosellana]|nr:transient receptor potential cation channel protein painless-like isoform X2 [Sitodiplosis mosellana]